MNFNNQEKFVEYVNYSIIQKKIQFWYYKLVEFELVNDEIIELIKYDIS